MHESLYDIMIRTYKFINVSQDAKHRSWSSNMSGIWSRSLCKERSIDLNLRNSCQLKCRLHHHVLPMICFNWFGPATTLQQCLISHVKKLIQLMMPRQLNDFINACTLHTHKNLYLRPQIRDHQNYLILVKVLLARRPVVNPELWTPELIYLIIISGLQRSRSQLIYLYPKEDE